MAGPFRVAAGCVAGGPPQLNPISLTSAQPSLLASAGRSFRFPEQPFPERSDVRFYG